MTSRGLEQILCPRATFRKKYVVLEKLLELQGGGEEGGGKGMKTERVQNSEANISHRTVWSFKMTKKSLAEKCVNQKALLSFLG
jgi:hypothetical protein